MIIGITGTTASGKDMVAEIVEEVYGFRSYSCSDRLRDELLERNAPETRQNLITVGNELRSLHGDGILAKRCLEKITQDGVKNATVTSIRHPIEAETLRNAGQFVLLAVDADSKLRYKRKESRAREGDTSSYEAFLQSEAREASGTGSNQQICACIEMANYPITNNGTVDAFRAEVLTLLKSIIPKLD